MSELYHNSDEISSGGFAKPGYYAVIPADVRYDDRLPPNAKLLYGEITALANAKGFCFATNEYFCKLYGFSDPTITRLLKALEDNGYIKREVVRDKSSKVTARKIWLSVSAQCAHPPINFEGTLPSKLMGPPLKNDGENNTGEYISIPPISPETAGAENAGAGKPGKRPRKNKDKPKADSKPKDLLDDEQLKTMLESQVKALGNEFQMDRTQKNRLYQIALRWYTPRTLASAKAAPPVHTELGISNLFRKVARGARVIGIDAAIEVFYDALSRGHTDIHDERFKIGYQPGGGKADAASVRAEGLGESW